MLTLVPGTRIYLAVAPVDMRKSFDGLSAVVVDVLKLNPLDGHLFLFRGKCGDKIKVLYWNRNGFALWYKRLEKGRFKWPRTAQSPLEISAQEFALLLDGIDFTKLKRLPDFHGKYLL